LGQVPGAPSFVRFPHKVWETTELLWQRKPNRKRPLPTTGTALRFDYREVCRMWKL